MATYLQLQDRVLGITNQSSTTARTRIKFELNQRYLRMQTGINLDKLRRTKISISVTDGLGFLTVSAQKIFSIWDDATRRVLRQVSMADIRAMDPGLDHTGPPTHYAISTVGPSSMSVFFWPLSSGTTALEADIQAAPTELSADGDIPNAPADFHDALVEGALADEWAYLQKPGLERKAEAKWEARLSELRLFLATSTTETMQQGQYEDHSLHGGAVWPYGTLMT